MCHYPGRPFSKLVKLQSLAEAWFQHKKSQQW